jgi:cell division protein FtsN
MAARGRRSSGTARLLVLVGIVAVLGGTFLAGVYAGRIWSARAAVMAAHLPDTEPARRGPGRGGRLPEVPAPQLTFYRELTAPLTAPPPPPRPLKTAPPPLATAPAAALAPHPGEQADVLAGRDGATTITNSPPTSRTEPAAPATTNPGRFTVQVGSYRVRPPAEALRESLASAGHDARIVAADANGPVYRVQIGEFPTREAARALATRLAGERPVTPFVTTR